MDDANLQTIYSKTSAIVVFVKDSKTASTKQNFPKLSKLVGSKKDLLYLTQDILHYDPLDFNTNTEVKY